MNKFTIILFLTALAARNGMCGIDKDKMKEIGQQCKADNGVSDEEVKGIMEDQAVSSQEGKCMMACIFKKVGLMSDDGTFNESGHNAMAEEVFKGDDDKLAKAKAFAQECKERVNSADDDDKGCERAAIMHACAVEKAKELGIKKE